MNEFTVTISTPDDMSPDRLEEILLDALYRETILSRDLDVKELEITGVTPNDYYERIKYWHKVDIERLKKERDKLKSYQSELLAKLKYYISEDEAAIRDLEQEAKALQFALENISNPDLIYSRLKGLRENK